MALDNRPQPPTETAAQRKARDINQRRGDWQLNAGGNLVYDADGRTDREYLQRKGDVYYTNDANGNPVRNVDENGRNDRIYVDRLTGNSAITGGSHDLIDELDHSDYIGPDA